MSRTVLLTIICMVIWAVHSYPSEEVSANFSTEQDVDPSPINDNSVDEEESDVSTLLEKANKNVGQELDEPTVIGDIAVPVDLGNADPCTSRGCKWKKSRNGKVYVPYVISKQFSSRERCVIERGLQSFASSTCVRFKRRSRERDYVHIQSKSGCYSYVGRRGGGQVVSLNRRGCVYHQIVQHELLHALGFNHEQTRSDRDQYVRILYRNIIRGEEHNFRKIKTNNLGTPYDYGSVMHYGRYAFSRNRQPTIVPIKNKNAKIGRARKMSRNDILRVNRLYGCTKEGVGQNTGVNPIPGDQELFWGSDQYDFAIVLLASEMQCFRHFAYQDNSVDEEKSDVSTLLEKANKNVDNSVDEEESDVSTLLEKANKNVGQELDEPTVIGDIAVPVDLGNADPCTSRGCKWRKSRNGKVYVPYVISKEYSARERRVIKRGLQSFSRSTCIRFKRRSREKDFVHIRSRTGCYSYIGRRGGDQVVSLKRRGCVYHKIVQHELLHALGFNHEQTRSDRDQYVRILYRNIIRGKEHNFRKIKTNNLGTPYDYGSVMHYGRYAFSRNRRPTIVPIKKKNAKIGRAQKMSRNDILRVNRLYGCSRAE